MLLYGGTDQTRVRRQDLHHPLSGWLMRSPIVGAAKDVEVDERINALAAGLAERFGDRALDVVVRQFDAADGEIKLVWGRIMEWLILHKEAEGRPETRGRDG
jgi:hypothetical protein